MLQGSSATVGAKEKGIGVSQTMQSVPTASLGSREYLTAGDLSRALTVDLKTVHNWVGRGRLVCRRTAGGHMRFTRTEVVRFVRRVGTPVPQELALAAPRAVCAGLAREYAALIGALPSESLYAALLEFAIGEYDILAINLDVFPRVDGRELTTCIRRNRQTCDLALIIICSSPDTCRSVVRSGADVAVLSQTDLPQALIWVTGWESSPSEERSCA